MDNAELIEQETEINQDVLIYSGGEVKALGDNKIGGYLIRFSTPKDTDLESDFFSKETELGITDGASLPVFYQHGADGVLKSRRIGRGLAKFDDVGLWLEAQLEMRDEYEKMILEMAAQGKLGWSSGAAGHLVDREQVGKAYHIKTWIVAEASLTPTPAEPRNQAVPLKSLLGDLSEKTAAETKSEAEADMVLAQSEGNTAEIKANSKESKMELTDEVKVFIKETANSAVEEFKKSLPAEDLAKISVTEDPADRPFKSVAEQCKAVKNLVLSSGRDMDPRLQRISYKATGASEGVPSEGGYLIAPEVSAGLIAPIHEMGVFSSKVRRLPTNSNYGWIPGVDETSRATGSRWGGVQGYRIAEGGTPTASKPKFRKINWELKKYAVLMYATDELLVDASLFDTVARQSAIEELNFMLNDDIMNGTGLAGCQGIMQSGSLVTVTRDTASKVLHADILAMWQRLHPAFRANAAWFVNSEVEPQLDALYHTTSVLSPYVNYTPEGVLMVKGKPVIVTEFNAALNTTGDILLADLSQYLMWDKAMEAATSIHVAFTTDEQAFRFIMRADGQSAFASAITPYKGSNTQSPFVVLGSAT